MRRHAQPRRLWTRHVDTDSSVHAHAPIGSILLHSRIRALTHCSWILLACFGCFAFCTLLLSCVLPPITLTLFRLPSSVPNRQLCGTAPAFSRVAPRVEPGQPTMPLLLERSTGKSSTWVRVHVALCCTRVASLPQLKVTVTITIT